MRKVRRYLGFAIVCNMLMLCGSKGVEEEAYIVKDGVAHAEIIVGAQPTRMQKLAADEFKKYVKKLTGADLTISSEPTDANTIKVYIGKSKYTDELGLDNRDLAHGAYRMVSGDNYLVLLGDDSNYLRDTPADGGPEYPATSSQRNAAKEAWHEKHGKMWKSPFMSSFKGYHKELGMWSVDKHGSLNAVNDFLRSLGVRWYMPGDFGEVLPAIKSVALPGNVRKTVRPDVDSRYIGFYFNAPFQATSDEFLWQLRLGFSYDTKSRGGHGTDALIRENEYVQKNHPEFYAKYGDTRNTGKPCYSSEGLKTSALGYASLMYDKYDYDVVSFMPTDGYTSHCQCELCTGKDTPERGFAGMMSDHVWTFMNDLAADIAEKYPNKEIRCMAYNTYLEPPLTIDKFHPNLQVGVCHHRNEFNNPESKKFWNRVTDAFIEKSASGRIKLWEYYQSGDHIPKYYPRIISENLKRLKGHVYEEGIESRRTHPRHLKEGQPDPCLAANHVNVWVTSRLWWDPDQDVDAMLEEYYRNFYGPAQKEMKAFIEHCENTWFRMRSEYQPIEKAFELIAVARKAAGEDTIYARRVQMVIDYIEPLHAVMDKLKIGRSQNPVAVMEEVAKPAIQLDGRLDEDAWQGLEAYSLKPAHDKTVVTQKTTFKVFYAGDSLYFGIRCEEEDMNGIVAAAVKNEDMTIFSGDSVEILLESPSVSYYQLAFDPKGNMTDIKRSGAALGKKGKIETKWDSGVEHAAYQGEGFWSVEIKIPALGASQDDLLPFYGVSGDKPTKEMPWYFNIGRIRRRDELEMSTFSPTGDSGFHKIMKFGKLTNDKRS